MMCCRATSKKKSSFRPKMVEKCHFFPENSFFLAGVLSCRAPYAILRSPDPLNVVYIVLEPTLG